MYKVPSIRVTANVSSETMKARRQWDDIFKVLKWKSSIKNSITKGNSLVVQWLGLPAFTAKGMGLIPGQGTKTLQAAWFSQKKKRKKKKKEFYNQKIYPSKMKERASLVAQWLRIRLPMQGTRVQALVWEDPTCRRATKPVRHNYWAYALEPASHNYWAHVPQLPKPVRLEPMLHNERSHRNEKPAHCNKE